MRKDGLVIGEVAKRSGATRKALRLYEEVGIIAARRRTTSSYRIYVLDTLDLLAFVRQAQRLGFTLPEIKEIVSIKRAGRLRAPTSAILCAGRRTTWTSGSGT